MPIIFHEETGQFHLFNDDVSYVMELKEQFLVHIYWGERIRSFTQSDTYPKKDRSSFSPNPYRTNDATFSLDNALQEFPGFDSGDYREPAFEMTHPDGTKATQFKYASHTIYSGKKRLEGLPATYVVEDDEAETLEITLADDIRGIRATLSYTIYRDRSAITKSVQYQNTSEHTIQLNRALSSCVDFDDAAFDLLQLPGAWAREKQIVKTPLAMGIHVLDSKRGASSTHQQPFIALLRKNTTEHHGDVYGFHFVYSGSFTIRTEVDTFSQTRVLVGINPHNFGWQLEPNAIFQTPEVVLVYAKNGLNDMSHTFHSLYTERLARGEHQMQERPVLINNWESTYFQFDEQKLLNLADGAKALGAELFVLDDGWFEARNDDTTSLGDWLVDRKKLPSGLANLSSQIHERGLKFGLWFEPEMISEQSQLFKAHPDWHIHVDGYPTSLGRNQLVLDFSRQEVRAEIVRQMTEILDAVPIDYIKWDMNRNMTEIGSRGLTPQQQMELPHRYMLGLYEVIDYLIERYPHILFENCSGGGGRFDPGMAYYMPQSWASDNTDAIERIKIQYGTSLIFPPVMICAQLSESPNHQVGRITPLQTRADVAMSANFGIMLDLNKESQETLDAVQQDIAWYKKNRQLIQFGRFSRLISPYESNFAGWSFTAPNQEESLVFFFKILGAASEPFLRLQLRDLNPEYTYAIGDTTYSGEELMKFGLYLNPDMSGDFQSKVLHLKRVVTKM
ncbi:alpha-galactosidase [Listeria booriae]|uniref:alpha-galactosidase n=1 Tax=Listeria booriae TaxID=1552123 RepID=UPI00164DB448|nr:alpha-galactosidase [Listeria booriae]MBC6300785.1 alpha-galactosidase [Listeria booriae]